MINSALENAETAKASDKHDELNAETQPKDTSTATCKLEKTGKTGGGKSKDKGKAQPAKITDTSNKRPPSFTPPSEEKPEKKGKRLTNQMTGSIKSWVRKKSDGT